MCADAWRWQSKNPNGYEKIRKQKVLTTYQVRTFLLEIIKVHKRGN